MSDNEQPATTPKVSAVMAVYNNCRYLPEAVESILDQTFRDFEFIIIDDGSTDGSGEWLEERAKTDPRIRLVRQENRGLTKSLNTGCALARGEFIARMDADDVSYPERFAMQVNALETRVDVVALGSQVRYIDADGVPQFIRRLPREHQEIQECHLSGWGGFLFHPAVMMRRSAFNAVGGYDERFRRAQDYDLWCRLGEQGLLANLSVVLLDYRRHADAVGAAARHQQSQAVQSICARELQKLGLQESAKLPAGYRVLPEDRAWLAKAAANDGFIRTTLSLVLRLTVAHLRGLLDCAWWVFVSFVQRFKKCLARVIH